MLRKLLKTQLALFVILVALNIYVYLYVGVEPPANPEDYCETTSSVTDDCIADLPGEFARSAIPKVSLIVFLLFPLIYFLGGRLISLVNPEKHKREDPR